MRKPNSSLRWTPAFTRATASTTGRSQPVKRGIFGSEGVIAGSRAISVTGPPGPAISAPGSPVARPKAEHRRVVARTDHARRQGPNLSHPPVTHHGSRRRRRDDGPRGGVRNVCRVDVVDQLDDGGESGCAPRAMSSRRQHLADLVAGQRVDRLEADRHLVGREVLAAQVGSRASAIGGPSAGAAARRRPTAPRRAGRRGRPTTATSATVGRQAQHLLDLAGEDLQPAAVDHVATPDRRSTRSRRRRCGRCRRCGTSRRR